MLEKIEKIGKIAEYSFSNGKNILMQKMTQLHLPACNLSSIISKICRIFSTNHPPTFIFLPGRVKFYHQPYTSINIKAISQSEIFKLLQCFQKFPPTHH